MVKHFYSHIIEIESLVVTINAMNLTRGQKDHLTTLVESQMHHTILDAIFSELSSEDKKHFLDVLSYENHEDIWKFLQDKVKDIEGKIKKAAEQLKKELHEDIKEAKRRI